MTPHKQTAFREWIWEQPLRLERWIGRQLFSTSFTKGDRSMLFILGHMRTGSSLLQHMLCSVGDVVGYGETGTSYLRVKDFGAVAANVYRRLRQLPASESYLLDKVVHKGYIVNPDVLRHPSVRLIFMLRDPAMALSSMVRNVEMTRQPESAYRHYARQIAWIQQLAEKISPEKWTHTTYNELVRDTPQVLTRLEDFLELSEPLSESYQTTQYTGVKGISDGGGNLDAGRVIRGIDRQVQVEVLEYVEAAREKFDQCIQVLRGCDRYLR